MKKYVMFLVFIFGLCDVYAQTMASSSHNFSMETGVNIRIENRMPLELNLMFTHKNNYGFQLGIYPGQYASDEVTTKEYYFHKPAVYLENYLITAIALRPSIYVVKQKKRWSRVNGAGLNYCYSKHSLNVGYLKPNQPSVEEHIEEFHSTITMEFYSNHRYYITNRLNINCTILMGINSGVYKPFENKADYNNSLGYTQNYRAGQGYYSSVEPFYFNLFFGLGYKLIQ